MSVDTELQAMRTHIADSYDTIENKGGIVPQVKCFANLSSAINTLHPVLSGNPSRYKFGPSRSLVVNDQDLTNSFKDIVRVTNNATKNYIYSYTNITGNLNFQNLTTIDSNNNMKFDHTKITGVSMPLLTSVGTYSCSSMFADCTYLIGAHLPSLSVVNASDEGCNMMFTRCTSLTTIDISALTTVSGARGCASMFSGCSSLNNVDLSHLTTVGSGTNACSNMFGDCTSLSIIPIYNLTTINSQYGCYYMFSGCTGLHSIDLSGLKTISGNYACASMFSGCTNLATINLSNLETINDAWTCYRMFQNSGLTRISFPKLTTIGLSSDYQFEQMFQGCSSLTEIHFRSDMRGYVQNLSGYSTKFGASNATIYFDL